MEMKSLYRDILNEHNINPAHKTALAGATHTLQGVNPSCGDNITLYLKSEGGIIIDGSFAGSGCAISQASVDMMLDLIIGRTEADALRLADNFMAMIRGTATEEQVETLEEAGALRDIAHMPARVKCALLGWRTMHQLLSTDAIASERTASGTVEHCGTS